MFTQSECHIEAKLLPDRGVVLIEPKGALGAQDFEYLASIVDPWIAAHGKLNGVVLHAHDFPGWENLGALRQHIGFVRDHHQKLGRLAVAGDSALLKFAPKVAASFLKPEMKTFDYDELDSALDWAAAAAV